MDASRALGLWRSTFGAVKIEPDNRGGGLEAGSLQGIWVYQRQGQGQTYQPSPYQRRQPYQPSQAQPPQQAPAPQRQPADPRYY
jgi:hypothetical protein